MEIKCRICDKPMVKGHDYGTDTLFTCPEHGNFRILNSELEELNEDTSQDSDIIDNNEVGENHAV